MSISYHGVIGHTAKATLPSVDMWGNNMNIIRDPPKSLYTRKIDKVGTTSELTQTIEEGSDRICENILTYARGVNPMVGVSYDGQGNSGLGKPTSAGVNGSIGNSNAFLPYRIMDKGAFRPPIYTQRDLLPLSRLSRLPTESYTNPGFVDFSKSLLCQSDPNKTKGVKSELQTLKSNVRPTYVYKINTPLSEPYEIKRIIQNPINVEAYSGVQPGYIKNGSYGDESTVGIIDNPLHGYAMPNQEGQFKKDVVTSHMNVDRYTHDVLQGEKYSNPSGNKNVTNISELYDKKHDVGIKNNTLNMSHYVNKSGINKHEYIHDDIQLNRNLPVYEASTNKRYNIHKSQENYTLEKEYKMNRPVTSMEVNPVKGGKIDTISNRNVYIKPTINAGGYTPNIGRPTYNQHNNLPEFDNNKLNMSKYILEMQQSRI